MEWNLRKTVCVLPCIQDWKLTQLVRDTQLRRMYEQTFALLKEEE